LSRRRIEDGKAASEPRALQSFALIHANLIPLDFRLLTPAA
jgi:hypothetical protein